METFFIVVTGEGVILTSSGWTMDLPGILVIRQYFQQRMIAQIVSRAVGETLFLTNVTIITPFSLFLIEMGHFF